MTHSADLSSPVHNYDSSPYHAIVPLMCFESGQLVSRLMNTVYAVILRPSAVVSASHILNLNYVHFIAPYAGFKNSLLKVIT